MNSKVMFKVFIVMIFSFFLFLILTKNNFDALKNQKYLSIYVVNDRKWTINGNVAQFSSILEVLSNNKYIIETLSFINKFDDKKQINLVIYYMSKFFVYEAIEIMPIPVHKTVNNVTHFYKVKFLIDIDGIDAEYIYVATILSEKNYKINFPELFTFQKPTVFSQNQKERILNCVHRLKNLNDDLFFKLFNWLIILKNIGYSKVIFYTYYAPTHYRRILFNNFEDFIEIIDYNLKMKDVCHMTLLKLENDPENEFFKNEKKNCINNYRIFFEKYNDKLSLTVDQAVNRLGTNDCLLHSKFNFKYLTNLDFDEFIFPRKKKTNFYEDFELNKKNICGTFENNKVEKKNSYDILSFIRNLKQNHNSEIAYFKFDNFQLLTEFKNLENQFFNNSNGIILYESKMAKLKFIFKTSRKINKIKELILSKQCLNKKLSNIHPEIRNIIGALIKNRLGKSIFITNNIFAISPHQAFSIRNSTNILKISPKIANVIHFRKADTRIDDVLPDYYFNIDIEYLFFLKNLNTSSLHSFL